jgi:hypothetical protein
VIGIGIAGKSRLAAVLARAANAFDLYGQSPPISFRMPQRETVALSSDRLGNAGATPSRFVALHGFSLTLSTSSHASSRIEACFDEPSSGAAHWIPMRPGSTIRRPDGAMFSKVFIRRLDANVPSNANELHLIADDENPGDSLVDAGAFPQISAAGSTQTVLFGTTLAGTEVAFAAEDNGAFPIAGWTGEAYVRGGISAAGRFTVNLITGQDGIAAGAGAVGATVPRVTLASDDPAVVALQVIDDWDEADRAKTNPIVGQAGVAANVGDAGATVQRVVEVTVPTAAATRVTVGAASGAILAANANRRAALILNKATVAGDDAVVNFGAAAVAATHFRIAPGGTLTTGYRGAINGIRGAATDVPVDVVEESY